MSVTRCLLRCALLLACGAFAAPRGLSSQSLELEPPLALQALDAPPADQETFGYLLPRLASKYRPSLAWGGVSDPRLYVFTELDNVQDSDDPLRSKRKQPSLSIVNPMDVLRQRLLLEIARKQMRENEIQAEKNRVFLKNVGKRDSQRDFLLDNFRPVEKRAQNNSKMAAVDRQANVNDYLPNDINVL